MKELWTTNPFHLMNSPFAEMGYSSSEPNIVPAHLLLAIRTPLAAPPRTASASPLRATRRPPTHHPLASGAASADANRCPHPLVRTSRRHYGRRFAGIGAPYPLLTIRLLPAQHPSAPCKPSARQLTAQCPPALHKPPANARRSICCLSATHSTASGGSLQAICQCHVHHHPSAPCTTSAISPQTIRHRAAHPLAPCTASVIARRSIRRPLRAIRWHPAGNLLARTDALNGPQNKPSARAGALNPRKNTFCVIVNCPLQIKPVFYFLFTSIASPAHRIRVKSSLLRLGRSCLALPFTHLGKDIT